MTKGNLTAVLDLELTHPFPESPALSEYRDALVLCRLRGTPVAAVRIAVEDGQLASDALVRQILDGHAWAFAAPLAERALSAGRLPGWMDIDSLLTPAPRQPTSGPLATLLVSGVNGAPPLDACLESIRALDYANTEIVVIADDEHERRRAVTAAQGDIVAFVDGRSVLDAQWLSRAVRIFLADPEVMAVTGLSLPRVSGDAVVPALMRQWYRGAVRPIGGDGTIAFWRTAIQGAPRASVDAVLRAGHTVVYEPAAITWTESPMAASVAASATTFGRGAEAVRTIDIADTLRPVSDASQCGRLRLDVTWNGLAIGTAHVEHHGAIVSPLWLTDIITQQLAAEVLDARMQLGRRVVWANLVSGLARTLAPRITHRRREPAAGTSSAAAPVAA